MAIEETIGDLKFVYEPFNEAGELIYPSIEIAKRYWLKDDNINWLYKPSEIARQLKIPVRAVPKYVASLIKVSFFDADFCENCGESDFINSRSDYEKIRNHLSNNLMLCCTKCIKQFELENALVEIDKGEFEREAPIQDLEHIAFQDAVVLQSILISCEDSWNGMQFKTNEFNLSKVHPNAELIWEFMGDLNDQGWFYPSSNSPDEAFELEPDGSVTFDMNSVNWHICKSIQEIKEIKDLIPFLKKAITNGAKSNPVEVLELWDIVVTGETLDYLKRQCANNKIKIHLYPTSYQLIADVSQYVSIGQIRFLIDKWIEGALFQMSFTDVVPGDPIRALYNTVHEYFPNKPNTNIHIETKNLDGLEEIRYTTSILFDQVLKSGEVGFREWSKTDVLKYLQGL